MGKRWSPDEKNESLLDIDSAKFIFIQAEKNLIDTIEDSQIIVARVTSIIIITIGILSGIIGYLFSQYYNSKNFDSLFYSLMLSSLYYFYLSCFMVGIIRPTKYSTIGSLPKDLFNEHFFKTEYNNNNRLIEYYKVEIINYNTRIEDNQIINEIRWCKFDDALWGLVLSPVLFIETLILLEFIHYYYFPPFFYLLEHYQ